LVNSLRQCSLSDSGSCSSLRRSTDTNCRHTNTQQQP
jgi:hypothetical protein